MANRIYPAFGDAAAGKVSRRQAGVAAQRTASAVKPVGSVVKRAGSVAPQQGRRRYLLFQRTGSPSQHSAMPVKA